MKKFFVGLLALFLGAGLLPLGAKAEVCALATGYAYKTKSSSSVYYVTEACTKRAFKSSQLYFTYFDSWSEVAVVGSSELAGIPDDELGFLPWGPKYDPKYGALVKTTDDPKVYFLLGNEKRWVDNPTTFLLLGYQWEWVEDVDARLLDKYKEGDVIMLPSTTWFLEPGASFLPNYTLVKRWESPKVYRIEPDPVDVRKSVMRHIANEEVFAQLNYRFDRIIEISDRLIHIEDDGEFAHTSVTTTMIDSMEVLREGEPITSPDDVVTVNVKELLEAEKASATRDLYYLRALPYYGFSFEYPMTWTAEYKPSLAVFLGWYELRLRKTSLGDELGTLHNDIDISVIDLTPTPAADNEDVQTILDAYIDTDAEGFAREFGNTFLLDFGEITVASTTYFFGDLAKVVIPPTDETDLGVVMYFARYQNYGYTFSVAFEEGKQDDAEETLAMILQTTQPLE